MHLKSINYWASDLRQSLLQKAARFFPGSNWRSIYDETRWSTRLTSKLGMTSAYEQRLYFYFASQIFQNVGDIVDLGCWLGSTTLSLAEGLSQNRRATKQTKLWAIDRFIWEEWMNYIEVPFRISPGESFEAHVKNSFEAHACIHTIKADLLKFIPQEIGNTEILLVDAMKSKELTETIATRYFSKLVPGSSYVIQQDFAHIWTPWLHLLHYLCRDWLKPMFHLSGTSTAVFKCTDKPREESYQLSDLSEKQVDQAFSNSLKLVKNVRNRDEIRACHTYYYLNLNNFKKAHEIWTGYMKTMSEFSGTAKSISSLLENKG